MAETGKPKSKADGLKVRKSDFHSLFFLRSSFFNRGEDLLCMSGNKVWKGGLEILKNGDCFADRLLVVCVGEKNEGL